MAQVAVGFRAERGGSVVVGVVVNDAAPSVVLSTFLKTAAEGDRLAFEPYHVAVAIAQAAGAAHHRDERFRQHAADGGANEPIDHAALAEAAAAVAEGRRRQDALAAEGLAAMIAELRGAGHDPVVAALLINRAGWL